MPAIKVNNLVKSFVSYRRKQGFIQAVKSILKRDKVITKAVDDITFSVDAGSIVGFLGPNGAGKSTTIKILSGIMHPDSGKASILGFVPWKERKKYVQNIGVVFGQKSQLLWDLPPIDAFYLNRAIYRIPNKKFDKQLKKLVNLLDIQEVIEKPTRQLSLGERMRCEFVIALLHQPKIVFLDEPTIGLDVFAKMTIRDFIIKINKKEKTTFIVTSHDLDDIERLCSKLIIINKGKIVYDDKVENLKTKNIKYVTVTLKQRDTFPMDKRINIIDKSPYSVTFSVNTAKDSIPGLLRDFEKYIDDIEITAPPITDLIKKHFGK